MKPARTDQAGFTLVELIVTLIVMTIVSLALANFIANWLQAATLAQARSNLLNNAETALDTINSDIRLSGDADTNNRWPDQYAPNAPTDELSWQSGSQILILAKVATDKNNNVIFSDPSKYITEKDNEIYYLSGNTLYRRTLASANSDDSAQTTCPLPQASSSCPADKIIATNVKDFSVEYYDADENEVTPTNARAIQLSITLASTQDGHEISASYNTRMVFRNN